MILLLQAVILLWALHYLLVMDLVLWAQVDIADWVSDREDTQVILLDLRVSQQVEQAAIPVCPEGQAVSPQVRPGITQMERASCLTTEDRTSPRASAS